MFECGYSAGCLPQWQHWGSRAIRTRSLIVRCRSNSERTAAASTSALNGSRCLQSGASGFAPFRTLLQPICRSVRGGKAVDRCFRNAAAALRRNQPTEWPENSRCRCGVGSSLRRQISTRNSRPSTRRVSLLRACCPSVVFDGGIVRGPRRGACGGISPVRVDAHFEVPLRRLTSRPFLLQARRHTSATTEHHGD